MSRSRHDRPPVDAIASRLESRQRNRDPMSRHFPLSWGEWIEGVHTSYDLQTVLEARLASGAELTPEEQHLLNAARRVTARYEYNGHRKRGDELNRGGSFKPSGNT
ncbi:MAG: hypothetical protein WBW33_25150 [Bryobacteraceae bacterium]